MGGLGLLPTVAQEAKPEEQRGDDESTGEYVSVLRVVRWVVVRLLLRLKPSIAFLDEETPL